MKRTHVTPILLSFIVPVLLFVGLTTAVFPHTAYAAPLETVTNLHDSGAGSLGIFAYPPKKVYSIVIQSSLFILNELSILAQSPEYQSPEPIL